MVDLKKMKIVMKFKIEIVTKIYKFSDYLPLNLKKISSFSDALYYI